MKQLCRHDSFDERFWQRTDRTTDCWVWTGPLDEAGYGAFSGGALGRNAHRVAFQVAVRSLADGEVVDHLCLNRACINPAHLEAVSQEENLRRMAERRDACVHGHARVDHWNGRRCKACKRESYHRNKRSAA